MVTTKRLRANELVSMLSNLLVLDVNILARVANVPKRNLMSWLSGKKDNLRLQSVMSLLTMLGFKFEDGIQLDDKRVHFWNVHDGLFANAKATYETIAKLSKLMSGAMITRVEPAKKSIFQDRDYYLIYGDGVRVVIIVRKSLFKKVKINPDVVKGACWRDDNDHHTITTNGRLWTNLTEKDLTIHEFDRIFMQIEETVSWGDLSLIAREFGVTPQQLSEWIMERFGETSDSPKKEDHGIDIVGGGQLLTLFSHNRDRAAAAAAA